MKDEPDEIFWTPWGLIAPAVDWGMVLEGFTSVCDEPDEPDPLSIVADAPSYRGAIFEED